MKVLVIGKGGREHALVWKLAQSPRVERVYCAPGNAGTAADGVNVAVEANDIDGLVRLVKKEGIDLTIVGPEEPLALGIVDALQKEGLRVFGPTRAAAQIESSKVFAKQLMRHADVPTAEFRVFDHPDPARSYIQSREYAVLPDGKHVHGPFPKERIITEGDKRYYVPTAGRRAAIGHTEQLVVKADGLAAGKGVFVCSTTDEAVAAVERVMVREEFGRAAGRQVVIEKRLEGQELSILALVSGRTIVPLAPTQDHKAVFDEDKGPNTGGMGAYCPAPLATPELLHEIDTSILVPTVHALRRDRKAFRGVLYAGLMITNQGPRVLEFNCRFGDPETQPLLMRLKTDLLDLLEAVVDDRLDEFPSERLEWDPRPAVCVVMASQGYPGSYAKGKVITGLAEAARLPGVKVFHAGTRLENGLVVT
ncbi:MAG: phosphoribosylamine--glycine ligase, partial [Gemmataceae bacterium]|nr:phosphoribosylamine--glycine ligase [Gemmataceae bacterium]